MELIFPDPKKPKGGGPQAITTELLEYSHGTLTMLNEFLEGQASFLLMVSHLQAGQVAAVAGLGQQLVRVDQSQEGLALLSKERVDSLHEYFRSDREALLELFHRRKATAPAIVTARVMMTQEGPMAKAYAVYFSPGVEAPPLEVYLVEELQR